MNTTRDLCVVLLLALCSTRAIAGAERSCARQDAIAAETQVSAKTWGDLYRTYRRYAQCDDGSVSETFSDSVAILLAAHWDRIYDLAALSSSHPSFEQFVILHVDVTMSLDQAKVIKRNATERCPNVAKRICGRILSRMAEFK